MHQRSTASRTHEGANSTPADQGTLPSEPGHRTVRKRQRGQAAVEAALTAAIAVMTILATLQLSLVAAQAFSAAHVARTTARWLAVRMDTIDSAVVTQAGLNATNLPGLTGMTVVVAPVCSALVGTPPRCPGRDTGTAATVTVTTTLSSVMFLPTTFGLSPFIFRLPTSMPATAYTVLLE